MAVFKKLFMAILVALALICNAQAKSVVLKWTKGKLSASGGRLDRGNKALYVRALIANSENSASFYPLEHRISGHLPAVWAYVSRHRLICSTDPPRAIVRSRAAILCPYADQASDPSPHSKPPTTLSGPLRN